ncbi:MAG: hypothetical protein IKE43_08060 [Coriobacteriales bacterium]|nr:hypothetical protein [Coriobacteriales bacterium]
MMKKTIFKGSRRAMCAALSALLGAALFMGATSAFAADPTGVAASSTLPADSIASYQIENIIDNDNTTAWVEGVPGNGEGEYFDYFYPSGTLITGGTIKAGYWKSAYLFDANGAPTRITVTAAGKSRTFDIPQIAPTFVTSGSYTYVDANGYQGFTFVFDEPLVSDGAVRITINSVRPGSLCDDTCISELHFTTSEVVKDGDRSIVVPDTLTKRISTMANYLYRWEVGWRDLYAIDLRMDKVNAHTKALLIYEYIYHNAKNDMRILPGTLTDPHTITAQNLESLCISLFGEADPAVINDFAQSIALSYSNGVYEVNSYGDFGDAGNIIFGGATLKGIERGRLVFTGEVRQYDSGAGQYGGYVPVASYTVFAAPNPAGTEPEWHFDELLVDYNEHSFTGDNGGESVPSDLVPGEDYAYIDAGQKQAYSADELADLAVAYYWNHYGVTPQYVEYGYGSDGLIHIHLYNIINLGPEDSHTGTLAWYFVDEYGIGTDIVDNYVDLNA